MKDKNNGKLLLELALHRYDEEVGRNEAIDNKNKLMVAFLGVMLTIQCTILIRLIELNRVIESFEMNLLLILFIVSFVLNLLALFFFISTLTYLDKLQSSPKIDNLVDLGIANIPYNNLIENTIVSLNKCVHDNKIILKEKKSKEKNGLRLLKMGLIVTTIFIIYILIIM